MQSSVTSHKSPAADASMWVGGRVENVFTDFLRTPERSEYFDV